MSKATLKARHTLYLYLKLDIGHALMIDVGDAAIDSLMLHSRLSELLKLIGAFHGTHPAQQRCGIESRHSAECLCKTVKCHAVKRAKLISHDTGAGNARAFYLLKNLLGLMDINDIIPLYTGRTTYEINSLPVDRDIYVAVYHTPRGVIYISVAGDKQCIDAFNRHL